MTHVEVELSALARELKAAQAELQEAISLGRLEGQRPPLRVLKLEVFAQISKIAAHIKDLRWLLREMVAKESDDGWQETLEAVRERNGATFVERVETIVNTTLSSAKPDPRS